MYRLVVYLKLIPELSNAKVCEGCYTLGQAIPTKKSLNDLLKLPLKDRGDVSDLTLLEGNTLFVTTSKDYMSKGVPSYHVGKLDLEKLVEAMPQYSGRNFRLIVIVNEKSALLKAMERAEMSSLNLVKRLKDPNTLIYDFDDLIRCFRPIRLYNEPISLSVRFHQRLATLRICELLRETKKVLYNAVCRSGKSYTMMDLILELRPKKCLILTTKPSETIVDLEKMCREYLVGYDVVKLRKGVEPSDSKTIYLGSKQFLDDKVNLMGGVNYFLKVPYKTECEFNGLKIDLTKYDVLIDPKHLTIVDHLWEKQSLKSIREIFLPRSTFPINTDGTHRITHELLFNKDGDTVCWVSSKQSVDRKLRVDSSKISSFKQTWKVITAEANGNQPNFGFMTSIKPNEIFTDSYIGFKVSSEQEANSLVSYLKCKLPNFLLALRKLTQHISNSTVKWIPLPPLDRTWTNENVYEYFSIDSSLQKLIK